MAFTSSTLKARQGMKKEYLMPDKPSSDYMKRVLAVDWKPVIHKSRVITFGDVPSFAKKKLKGLVMSLSRSKHIGDFFDHVNPRKYLEFGLNVINTITYGGLNQFVVGLSSRWREIDKLDCETYDNVDVGKLDQNLLRKYDGSKAKGGSSRKQKAVISLHRIMLMLLKLDPRHMGLRYKREITLEGGIVMQENDYFLKLTSKI